MLISEADVVRTWRSDRFKVGPSNGFFIKWGGFRWKSWELINNLCKEKWGVNILCKPIANGFYLVTLASMEDKQRALNFAPLFMNGAHMHLFDWKPGFDPKNERVLEIAVWFYIYNLPLEFWGDGVLKSIGRRSTTQSTATSRSLLMPVIGGEIGNLEPVEATREKTRDNSPEDTKGTHIRMKPPAQAVGSGGIELKMLELEQEPRKPLQEAWSEVEHPGLSYIPLPN
ncbi:hypothetical protein SUGI_0080900 [Cryptomeria japonica]|nr:hypothetical protein SUGI_0080900 [Cryptomeria japonica]